MSNSNQTSSRPDPPHVQLPQEIVIRQRTSGLGRSLATLGWIGFLFCLVLLVATQREPSDGVEEKFHSGEKTARNKIAIISVEGTIIDGEGFVKRQIDRVRDDDRVKGVVVRINSPGGTVYGSDHIHHQLRRLREEKEIPMVVSMGGVAASGGYYVAMAVGDQERSIFAEPITTTGSIGVIIPYYDLTGLLDRLDIKDESIATHPNKQMLSMTRPLTEEQRAVLEKRIDEAFHRFKEIIKEGRPMFRENPEKLDELATGEVFTGLVAHEHGLVDEVGFLEDAIERLLEMAQLDEDEVRVVQYKRPFTLGRLFTRAEAEYSARQVELLRELALPRPYYLSTSLPPALSALAGE